MDMDMKKKLFIDFDGVLNTYDGWCGEDELFQPREGSLEFLKNLSEDYAIYIFTARDREKVYKWMIRHQLYHYIQDVTNKKEPAHLYIDDRALSFNGDYNKIIEDVKGFRPYWKQSKGVL